MKILITGGTGFIGSRLAVRCVQQGNDVMVLALENNETEASNRQMLEEAGVNMAIGSVTERAQVNAAVQGMDVVFHLAAVQHEMNVPDQKFRDVNVEGTRHMLEASLDAGVQRFVHGSTIGVYGYLDGLISEETACNPDNIYGETKYEGEKLVLSYRDKLPVVVIRISETYGPGDYRLLKLFKAINKSVFFMIGKGENLHHPIYIDDLVDGFLLAATSEKAVGELFVLSGKEAVTTNKMVAAIAQALGKPGPRLRIPLFPMMAAAMVLELTLRPLGIQPPLHRRRMDFFRKGFSFSQEKSRDLLNFEAAVGFQQGAKTTADWYERMGYLA
jgi:dihydroflavonol-4-reductase